MSQHTAVCSDQESDINTESYVTEAEIAKGHKESVSLDRD